MGNGPAKLCLFPIMLIAIIVFSVAFRELALKERRPDLPAPTKSSRAPNTTRTASTGEPVTTPSTNTTRATTSTGTTSTSTTHPPVDADGYCRTDGCKKTAETFLSMILPTADPCQDFYKFACGKFMQDHPFLRNGIGEERVGFIPVVEEIVRNTVADFLKAVPLNKTATGADRKVTKTYQLCMETNRTGLDAIRETLHAIGGLPFSNKPRPAMSELLKLTGATSFPLYSYTSAPSDNIHHPVVAIILQPVPEQTDEQIARHYRMIDEFLAQLHKDFGSSHETIVDDAEYRAFFADLHRIRDETDLDLLYMDAEDITEQFPNLKILEMMRGLFPRMELQFQVESIDYFKKINALYLANEHHVKEGLVVKWLLGQMNTLGHGYEEIRKKHQATYLPLPDYCASQMIQLHPRWADIVLREHLYPVELIETVYHIKESPWADPPTQENVSQALSNMQFAVGQGWTWPRTDVESYYNSYYPANAKNWFEFLRQRGTFVGPKELKDPTTEFQGDTNASNGLGTVSIMWGLLTAPFYHPDASLELQYGGLGMIIGHELTHTIDPGAIEFKPSVLAGEEDKGQFKEQVECIEEQYGNAGLPENTDFRQPGDITRDEAVADNAGLRVALRAYRKERKRLYGKLEPKLPGLDAYTPDQLYYVAAAMFLCDNNTKDALEKLETDGHPPGYIRLNEMVKNSKEFSRVYKCPLNSPMNPQKKCYTWRHKKRH